MKMKVPVEMKAVRNGQVVIIPSHLIYTRLTKTKYHWSKENKISLIKEKKILVIRRKQKILVIRRKQNPSDQKKTKS